MTVNVLIITHNEIGQALLSTVNNTLGGLPLNTTVIKVDYQTVPESLITKITSFCDSLQGGQELLVLTDLYGATPTNIARCLQKYKHVRIVSGLNLPMLIRVMNYPSLSLPELTYKALSGGREGIVCC